MIHADNEFRTIFRDINEDWEVDFNFSLTQQHVPDIEHKNRFLQEQFHVGLYRLPYKKLPKVMIRYLSLRVTRKRSYFPKNTGISKVYSPHTILKSKQVDFNKEFVHSFGNYIQVVDDRLPKNNNLPRSIDSIYLRADDSLQGGHKLMDFATGRVFTRATVTACAMTRMAIERVELIATRQGFKTLKFFNRKKEEMILTDADLLEGVGRGGETFLENEESHLPPLVLEGVDEDSDEELDVDEGISNEDIADFLEDIDNQIGIQRVDPANIPLAAVEDETNDEESEDERDPNCLESDQDSSGGSSDGGDAPSLVSEPPVHATSRSTREPERYNPTSGTSYHQMKQCHHNLVKQTRDETKSFGSYDLQHILD